MADRQVLLLSIVEQNNGDKKKQKDKTSHARDRTGNRSGIYICRSNQITDHVLTENHDH